MDAASNHRAHAQGVRRWRKWFGWASIVFFCLFSGMLVYMPWALWFFASAPPQTQPTSALRGGLAGPQPRFQETAAVLTADANIREGPSTDTPLVGTISAGAWLTVTGRMEGYDWYRVRLQDETTGYILSKLMLIPEEGAWLLAPAHTLPAHIFTADAPAAAPAIVTDPPATDAGKEIPKLSSTLPSPQPTPPMQPGEERRRESGFRATSAPLMPLMISAGALAVSLLGFLSTTVLAWRVDRRAMRMETRAEEEHGWKKNDREASPAGFGL